MDLFETRLTGLPDSHDPSESTEASDCDILLPIGKPGLTGESERMLATIPSEPTRIFSGFWFRRRAAIALVEGTSGDATRESGGEIGNSGKSSLNLDMVRRGTLASRDGLLIWMGALGATR